MIGELIGRAFIVLYDALVLLVPGGMLIGFWQYLNEKYMWHDGWVAFLKMMATCTFFTVAYYAITDPMIVFRPESPPNLPANEIKSLYDHWRGPYNQSSIIQNIGSKYFWLTFKETTEDDKYADERGATKTYRCAIAYGARAYPYSRNDITHFETRSPTFLGMMVWREVGQYCWFS
jgi:hypothetical protein